MNAKQAIAKLRKGIGPKIGWRENRGALNASVSALPRTG